MSGNSHSKGSSVSVSKIGDTLLKTFMSFMRFAVGFIGRFFSREIPLQVRYMKNTATRIDTMNMPNAGKVALAIIVSTVLTIVLIFWAILRALFVPNAH